MLSGPEQVAQEISQFKQILLVLLGQVPFAQEVRHVVESTCRKYPALQDEH